MVNFLENRYYLMLVLIAIYFLFNVTLRDPLVNYLYHINPDQSITNAAADAAAERLKGIISLGLLVSMLLISIISVLLLLLPGAQAINKMVLITIPVLVALLCFCILSVGGFVGFGAGVKRLW